MWAATRKIFWGTRKKEAEKEQEEFKKKWERVNRVGRSNFLDVSEVAGVLLIPILDLREVIARIWYNELNWTGSHLAV